MAEGGVDERQSFGNFARSLKKYGSTCNHVKKPPNSPSYHRHEVEAGETLQGLALKYSVSMEQIRRANRLWASDSLFVRETLLIPVENGVGENSATASMMLSPSGFSADSGHSSDSSGSSEPAILREEPTRRVSAPVVTTRDQSDASLEDFLGKIDSAIARTKHQVAKHRGSSEFWSGEEDVFTQPRRKPAMSRLRQHHNHVNNDVQTAIQQPGHGRRVLSSLQRLEQTQDEMFQL